MVSNKNPDAIPKPSCASPETILKVYTADWYIQAPTNESNQRVVDGCVVKDSFAVAGLCASDDRDSFPWDYSHFG